MTATLPQALDPQAFFNERLRSVENGSKLPGTFSEAEMNRRLSTLRSTMESLDLDAVVLTSMHNIKYYSDFLLTSFGRHYALVVTADSAVTITASIDGGMPYRRGQVENVVYTDWQRDNNIFGIVSELKKRCPGLERVGYEADVMPVELKGKLGDALSTAFPSAELVDVYKPIMKLRMIKSEEEIALIKNGTRTADIGGQAIKEALQSMKCGSDGAGLAEYELALIGTEAMVKEIARLYPDSELRDTWVWFQSGINTDGAHTWPTTRKVREGDILSLNCFPMTSGYYVALERTMFYGEPDEATLSYWEINMEVYRRGLELIRPGVRCCDIARELNEIYAAHDALALRTFGYGHSFGVLSHYYGREAGLEIREDIETVLEPGMVVSMEPMIMVPEGQPGAGGYREHDILVIGEDSVENITGFPAGPEDNCISPLGQ